MIFISLYVFYSLCNIYVNFRTPKKSFRDRLEIVVLWENLRQKVIYLTLYMKLHNDIIKRGIKKAIKKNIIFRDL